MFETEYSLGREVFLPFEMIVEIWYTHIRKTETSVILSNAIFFIKKILSSNALDFDIYPYFENLFHEWVSEKWKEGVL
jgi:hypothetical protein